MERSTPQSKGLEGEQAAARLLESLGFTVLERRYRCGHKEIDLIAGRDDLVVFVEVKRRLNGKYGDVRASIDKRKQRNLVAAAEGWLYRNDPPERDRTYRFDVILLHPPDSSGKVKLEHIEDAFRP